MPSAANYDPAKAHAYYERIKKLKGRQKGDKQPTRAQANRRSVPTKPNVSTATSASSATVNRLKAKVDALTTALSEAQQALSEKRQAEAKTKKESSDGKTTVAERQASQKWRDTHKAQVAAESKKSASGSGSSSSSSSTSVSSMSVDDLVSRVSRIQSALGEAKRQLAEAIRSTGTLAHADLIGPSLTLGDITLLHSTSRKDPAVETADFSGYATQYGLRCSDGRTILPGAFDDDDGMTVPLVWQHGHEEITNTLGHVKLEKRDNGIYAYAFFNATASGQHAKEMVRHGDTKWLSIWANQLVERVTDASTRAKDVLKGKIREVSLVLGGANPGAFIDNVQIAHGDGVLIDSDEAYITTGIDIEIGGELSHAGDDETVQDILDTLTEKQQNAVNFLVSQALLVNTNQLEHSDENEGDDSDDSNTSGDAEGSEDDSESTDSEGSEESDDSADSDDADTDGSDEAEGSGESDDSADSEDSDDSDDSDAEGGDAAQHSDNQEDKSMTHNVFDQSQGSGTAAQPQVRLSHDNVRSIVEAAKRGGSLKQAVEDFIAHTGITVDGQLQHGIENIDYLFPDAKLIDSSPAFVSRRMEWVDNVLSNVRKSPFSRIKSVSADITPDEARARGYIKGNLKNEEYFAMSKRVTTPQTIYKKQKLDRDDVIDITDLDVVAWLKAEMKVMLDEELAGAILVGDGRSVGDDDKIIETNIRPVATDAELYVTTAHVNLLDASSTIEELVDSAILHRRYYKGSGTPSFYTTEAVIGQFLTVKDNFGRRVYQNISEVASALRVKEVIPVEIMERDDTLLGVMVNLADYTLGADRGGQATMFDDFDIDYNKLLYLIETRVSGALTLPKSAVVFRSQASGDVLLANPTAPVFDPDDSTVTVPTVSHVTYKSGPPSYATTETTGSPHTLAEGVDLHVKAFPASGYYFADDANDEWDFTGVDV